MVRVLFVCLGNICRSTMAEAVFRHQVEQAGLSGQISADSAGTGSWHIGEPPHTGTRRALRQHGISYDHIARQIRPADFQQFDYIIAVDEDNLDDLRRFAPPGTGPKIHLLLDYASGVTERNVPDPYYSGNFERVYELVSAGATGLLDVIRRQHDLPLSADRSSKETRHLPL